MENIDVESKKSQGKKYQTSKDYDLAISMISPPQDGRGAYVFSLINDCLNQHRHMTCLMSNRKHVNC